MKGDVMQGDQVWRWIPPEFTVKHLAIGLVLLGFAFGCLVEVYVPSASLLLIGCVIYWHYHLIVKRKVFPRVATLMYWLLAIGTLLPTPLLELMWFLQGIRNYDPKIWERSPELFSPEVHLAFMMAGLIITRGAVVLIGWMTGVEPALRVLPKGWDTPVRYYLD